MPSTFEIDDETVFAKIRYYGPFVPNSGTWQPQPSAGGFVHRFWFIGGWSNGLVNEDQFLIVARKFCENWFGPSGELWSNRGRHIVPTTTFGFKEEEHAKAFRRFWPMILKETQANRD